MEAALEGGSQDQIGGMWECGGGSTRDGPTSCLNCWKEGGDFNWKMYKAEFSNWSTDVVFFSGVPFNTWFVFDLVLQMDHAKSQTTECLCPYTHAHRTG